MKEKPLYSLAKTGNYHKHDRETLEHLRRMSQNYLGSAGGDISSIIVIRPIIYHYVSVEPVSSTTKNDWYWQAYPLYWIDVDEQWATVWARKQNSLHSQFSPENIMRVISSLKDTKDAHFIDPFIRPPICGLLVCGTFAMTILLYISVLR